MREVRERKREKREKRRVVAVPLHARQDDRIDDTRGGRGGRNFGPSRFQLCVPLSSLIRVLHLNFPMTVVTH
jgi:hypothetical protein